MRLVALITVTVLLVAGPVLSILGSWTEAEGSAPPKVPDKETMQAIVDALHVFDADAIVIATNPPARSNWLARDLVGRVRRRFDRPVVHVVVDSARHREYVLEEAA